jgi:protein SFI1
MFHRWLSAARASRYRRVALQQKEEDIRHGHLADAWDKWRDRFRDAKLRPIVS